MITFNNILIGVFFRIPYPTGGYYHCGFCNHNISVKINEQEEKCITCNYISNLFKLEIQNIKLEIVKYICI